MFFAQVVEADGEVDAGLDGDVEGVDAVGCEDLGRVTGLSICCFLLIAGQTAYHYSLVVLQYSKQYYNG